MPCMKEMTMTMMMMMMMTIIINNDNNRETHSTLRYTSARATLSNTNSTD